MDTLQEVKILERVYFSDWLFNAGILGFMRILNDDKDIFNNPDINMENFLNENYFEFNRDDLKDFSHKYFKKAFKQYGRYDKNKDELEKSVKSIESIIERLPINEEDEKTLKRINERYKSIIIPKLISTKLKEKEIVTPIFNDSKKNPLLLKDVIYKTLMIMENNYQEFFEAEVQIYLRRVYGQKSFLGNSVKNRFQKFYEDYEEPIMANSNKTDKELLCMCCASTERKAKKGINFDTGISPFYGINPDAINFFWNFDPRIPLCEICELIYFCAFAGFVDTSTGKEQKFCFVNSDNSIERLIRDNDLLESSYKKNEVMWAEFFTELILQGEERKSKFVYQNISVIELNLTNETFPKVYSQNISRTKAKFISDNIENLRLLAKVGYKVKDDTSNLLIELMSLILNDRLNYRYITKLMKIFSSSELGGKSDLYRIWFGTYNLQIINILTFKFLQTIVLRRKDMQLKDGEIWGMYHWGLDFSKYLKKEKLENKINSIAYKLSNALRIGDVNSFMDIIIRIHIANNKEIPSTFVKAISDKNTFYPIGYSFINGLLGQENKKKDEGENSNG